MKLQTCDFVQVLSAIYGLHGRTILAQVLKGKLTFSFAVLILARVSWTILKLINNSSSQNKANHYREGGLEMWS